jgi:hypothetical protein
MEFLQPQIQSNYQDLPELVMPPPEYPLSPLRAPEVVERFNNNHYEIFK